MVTVSPWPEACLRPWEPLVVWPGLRHPEGRSAAKEPRSGFTLFIPSFYYQMTPKIPLNTRCSISISKNLSINGRTRSSDQLGIWSYNINP